MTSELLHIATMHTVKGGLLGFLGFIVFNSFYLKAWFGPFQRGKAIGVGALRATTIDSPSYWTVLVLMVALGALVGHMWPIPVTPDGMPR
ncbi:MAG TPA: hypothetical protein VHR84_01710 [Terriglobales bacterium]|nr:hypothetical protein [Terriglobales bacterium]